MSNLLRGSFTFRVRLYRFGGTSGIAGKECALPLYSHSTRRTNRTIITLRGSCHFTH